ncbi:hypothetical protein FCG40_01890 [Fimbriimonadia bacterium ATM]|nr:MAG: hypothetical protein EDM73_09595 [Armatimonadota bacterium]MDL1927731.1 hypothetical protein [Fimbriimonadia bacterium ATM]
MTRFDEIAEAWKLCTSCQFVGKFRIRELAQRWQSKLRFSTFHAAEPFSLNQDLPLVLDLENQIWHIAEYFEFAARLAKEADLKEGMKVAVSLVNAGNCAIGSDSILRYIGPHRVNRDDVVRIVKDLRFDEISSRPYESALSAAKHFLAHFQSDDIRDDVIRQIISDLYQLRIGEDASKHGDVPWRAIHDVDSGSPPSG